jgi:hypothetical protein
MVYYDYSDDSSLFAQVCLDPRDPGRVARTSRLWLERGWDGLFGEVSRAVAAKDPDAAAGLIVCGTERDPIRAVRRTDARWAAALARIGENPVLVDTSVNTVEKRLSYAATRLTVSRVLDRNPWVRLSTRAMLGRAFDPAVEYDRWVDFVAEVLDDADPAYAEVNKDFGVEGSTDLDRALRRDPRRSAEQSRRFLRGYAWVTVVPQELVDRLGGMDAIEAAGAVSEVRPLSAGGVLLRATRTPEEYDGAAVERLFRLLVPVLPPGQPRARPEIGRWYQLVYEDASANSGGQVDAADGPASGDRVADGPPRRTEADTSVEPVPGDEAAAFFAAFASNGEQLCDPSEEELAALLRRLGRTDDMHLRVKPIGDDSSWELGVHVTGDARDYWLFWRDFVLGRHSSLDSSDPAEVAQRITHLVGLSAGARG